MKRVVVGLSGGVDSSVAASLLVEQGYEVIGLFMKNWHDESVTLSDECPWLEDSNDALLVAEKLGIAFQTVDLSKEYEERIIDYMFSEYRNGRTPNPDVLCNREIKFDAFLKVAIQLGAQYVATGHYCRKQEVTLNHKTVYRLLAGKDDNKDQSYFLCQLTQKQLAKTLFPVGELTKGEVRKMAKEKNLITAEKKDSQGLCFVGKVKLPDFLQQKLSRKIGNIIEVPPSHSIYGLKLPSNLKQEEILQWQSKKRVYNEQDGKIVGTHPGAHYFTIGQRKGLQVGGTPEPLFVIDTDVKNNLIFTGQGKEHPGLLQTTLFIENKDVHWVREDLALTVGQTLEAEARIRYRQKLQKCTLYQTQNRMYVDFEVPQSAITPGQFVAWYKGDELLGSGVIS